MLKGTDLHVTGEVGNRREGKQENHCTGTLDICYQLIADIAKEQISKKKKW